MKHVLRGADVLARTLAAAGVRHVFTLSGNHVMPVFDAALDAKLSLVHVRDEAAAACGAARAHGLDLLPTRYGAIGSALGAHGEDLVSIEGLENALQRATAAAKPALVNVMIERTPASRY